MQKINITLAPDQNLYLTSDLHFGHRNVIRFCDRPFVDEKDMGKALLGNWNNRVHPNDFIFNLGDTFWFNDRHSCKKIVQKMHGKKYFILGNHCSEHQYELIDDPDLHICSDIVHLYVRGQESDPRFAGQKVYEIVLSHYPMSTFSHCDAKNCFHFFGHIHSRKGQPMLEFGHPIALAKQNSMDVGVDRHDYAPVEFFEALQKIKDYPYWDMHIK